jgi:hypothetical protein
LTKDLVRPRRWLVMQSISIGKDRELKEEINVPFGKY